jgi:hypothetical protein
MKRWLMTLFLFLSAMLHAATYYIDGTIITAGTAQGAGDPNSADDIQLAADAPATDMTGYGIRIISGTGATTLNDRKITSYNTETKVAVVNANWATDVDETSVYQVTVGSNLNNGSEAAPFQTFNGAVGLLSGTQTIYVTPAVYNEKQSTNNYLYISTGGNGKNLTFQKNPAATGDVVIATTDTNYCVRIGATTATMTFIGITFAPVSHAANAAIYLTSVSCSVNLIDCVITNIKSDANAFGFFALLASAGSGSFMAKGSTFTTSSSAIAINPYFGQTIGTILIDDCDIIINRATNAGIGISLGADADTNEKPICTAFVLNNRISFIGADNSHGILIGSGVNGSIVEGNRVTGADIQLVVKSEFCTIRNNLLIATGASNYGSTIKGGCFNRFVGNTIYSEDFAALQIQDGGGGAAYPSFGNIVTDNVFYCIADQAVVVANDYDGNILDYNCYYSTGTNVIFLQAGNIEQSAGIAAVQAAWQAIGDRAVFYNDLNSLILNPALDANYKATSSALQNAGSPILLKSDGTVLLRNPIGATAGGGSEKSVFGVKRSVFGN